jgi:putative ABC transport system substrate-binding protein
VRRREFITIVGGTAATWPLAARAQQPSVPVIGFLSTESPDRFAPWVEGFRQGLKSAGYAEGENVAIEYRWAEGHYDRLPALAADLVRRQVTVIAATDGLPSVMAAKAATGTLPIVFLTAADPIAFGLVASLNRPGGNITGVVTLNAEVGPKRLELLHEAIPTATAIALVVNPTNRVSEGLVRDAHAASRSLGLRLHVLNASSESDFDTVFSTLIQLQAGALAIGADPFFNGRSAQLAVMALRHAVPSIYQYREFAAAGGLMSYGTDIHHASRQVGVLTARILKGDKPADLPVQQVTKVELIINLKTAQALGLTLPLPLLGRADEVIE